MNRRSFLGWTAAAVPAALLGARAGGPGRKPNIVFILADDLGRGDLGCYGQTKIRTPCIDRLAAGGMRFTQGYCGTSVCAPSRCSLMTGLHIGHAPIRANREIQPEGQGPLPEGTFTLPRLLKSAGYATACTGKWGLGFVGSSGDPLKVGFDHFFGYNCQRQAHSFYPNHLWRDDRRVELDGKTYAYDLTAQDALDWIRAHKDGPFFLFCAFTPPHETVQVPELEPYTKDQPWTEHQRTYASIVSRMDRDVGRIVDLLRELKLDADTVVFFCSDNGSDNRDAAFFDSNNGLRGTKRSMYEGGIRVPVVAWGPGRVKPGTVSDVPIAFWDILPTAAEWTGAKVPSGVAVDGVSIAGLLEGGPAPQRDHLYWELHEPRFMQAVRRGNWKAVRNGAQGAVELYDIAADPMERSDVAAAHPDVTRELGDLLRTARVDSPDWPIRPDPVKGGNRKKQAK